MSTALRRGLSDWGAGCLAGAAVLAGTVLWFGGAIRRGATPSWRPISAGLQLHWDTGAQEARLMDPSALFLPGAATAAAPAGPRTAGAAVAFSRLAEWSPPELAFRAQDLQIPLPPPVRAPASAAEALAAHPPGNPALGFGRADAPVPVLPPRAGAVEILDLRTGAVVFRGRLPVQLGADTIVAPETFYLSVSAVGPVGAFAADPARSGQTKKLLDAALGPGHRLAPGSYRISIGP